ncbi:MAG TPA: sugar ABC transporter permease [Jatrophihabitantaceae bacterium]|nr:sugar ABC transporter permease [Jatrophihabitantaceae bacterium]
MSVLDEVAARPTEERRRRRYLFDRERVLGPALLLPAVLYLVAVVGYPLVLAILYAFSDVTTGSQTLHFVGWSTFRSAIDDPVFGTALRNSFLFTAISQACVVVLSTVLAFVLTQDFRGKWFFRFLVLLPWTTPVALSAVIWLWMLDSIFSPFNWLLVKLHVLSPGGHVVWLGGEHLAISSVIALQTWRILPLATVIVMAGLSSIPQDIRDATEVDGARFWRRTFQIDLPLLAPVILVAVLFGIVFTFADMAVIFILTGGAPGNGTQVLASWAFYKGINGGNLAVGAADAVFMFPVLLALAAIVLRFARRSEVG